MSRFDSRCDRLAAFVPICNHSCALRVALLSVNAMSGIVIWAARIQERFRHAALVDAYRRLVLRQYVGVRGKRYMLIVHVSCCRTEIMYPRHSSHFAGKSRGVYA